MIRNDDNFKYDTLRRSVISFFARINKDDKLSANYGLEPSDFEVMMKFVKDLYFVYSQNK